MPPSGDCSSVSDESKTTTRRRLRCRFRFAYNSAGNELLPQATETISLSNGSSAMTVIVLFAADSPKYVLISGNSTESFVLNCLFVNDFFLLMVFFGF